MLYRKFLALVLCVSVLAPASALAYRGRGARGGSRGGFHHGGNHGGNRSSNRSAFHAGQRSGARHGYNRGFHQGYRHGAYHGMHVGYRHGWHGGVHFGFWGGWWHPIGFLVTTLAVTAIVVNANNQQYHYDQGVYYVKVDEGYKVVPAPAGAKVTALPENSVQVTVNSEGESSQRR